MIKRSLSFLLALTLTLLFIPFGLSAYAEDNYNTGSYLVESSGGVRLYEKAEISAAFETVAPKGAYLNIIKTDGAFGYTVFDSVYGWVELSENMKYVSEYPSLINGKIEGVKGLAITKMPDKLTYIEGEESAEVDGLEISVVFNDKENSKMKVSGYNVAFPSLDTYGEKQAVVHYGGFSASFPIRVNKVPVTGIVISYPDKTSYVEGEPVSFDGLTVTAFYSDGRDGGKGLVLPESEYAVTGVTEGDSSLAPGVYNVTVTYKYPEISASFHIYVSGRSVKSLSLLKMPSNPTIYQGQTFNKDDFELSASYDNSKTETITDFDIQYDNMTVGTYTARIYYMDKYVAFDYTVLPLIETGIETGDTASVGSYVGSAVDFGNLRVYALYNSGEKKQIEDYSLQYDINTEEVGSYPVTVTHGGFTATFNYTVALRPQTLMGDVDLNGIITAADARLALRASARLETLSAEAFSAADVDLNGNVTASDARKILRVSAGLDKF